MKKFIVAFVDEDGGLEFEQDFSTRSAAEKYIASQVKSEDPNLYSESCSWGYIIFENIAAYEVSVKITKKLNLSAKQTKK